MTQQSHEDLPSFDQVKILNVSCKNEGELLLNISLEKVLAVDIVNEITVISDEMDRIFRS